MKNSKNNNIMLGFSFMYLVSVDATNKSKNTKKTKNQKTKTADFYVNTGILIKLLQKKPK